MVKINHFTLYNQKIFNILNDPNKLEEKKIDCLPIDIPLLTRSSNCPELQREYNRQYSHKTNIRTMVNKIKIYGKIKSENNKKYNDYYVCLKLLMFKYRYFGYYDAMNVMEYLIIDDTNFNYQPFINKYINPLKMNSYGDNRIVKCGTIFMNVFWNYFTKDELCEFYDKICNLQKEINNKNYYHRRNYIKNKIYNIINYYNIQFIDDYVLETFMAYNLL